MDRYITITSQNQTPWDFVSNFGENLYLEGEYEIALKSIYHAPAYNITEKECRFELYDTLTDMNYKMGVPPGFYENEIDVLGMMYKVTKNLFQSSRKFKTTDKDGNPVTAPVPKAILKKEADMKFTLGVLPPNAKRFAFVCGPSSPITRYLGYILPERFEIPTLQVDGTAYVNSITPGFIYSSCVKNSIVDQQQSRLLAIVPFQSNSHYNHYEIENPCYVPLASQSLRDVSFTFCNKDGNPLRLENVNDGVPPKETLMVLHLRKKL